MGQLRCAMSNKLRRTAHFFILALHLRLFDIAHRSCNFFNSAKEFTATFGMILRIMESRLSNHAEQECDERVSDSFSRGIMVLHFCELDAQVFIVLSDLCSVGPCLCAVTLS